MPTRPPLPTVLLLGLSASAGMLAAPGGAVAQVTTSQGALDTLGGGHPHRAAAPNRGTSRRPAPGRHAVHGQRTGATRTTPVQNRPAAPAATIPAAAPPIPVFKAPVVNVPLHPPPPPPPVPVVQTAVGTVSALPDGTRITFGDSSADLDPATMAALHGFADRLKGDPSLRVDLDADAAGSSDDPSTPRRLALSRGLAARAVLINDGIASTRIYLRVFGPAAPGNEAPRDRVDLHAVGTGTTENPGGPPATGLPQPPPGSTSPG